MTAAIDQKVICSSFVQLLMSMKGQPHGHDLKYVKLPCIQTVSHSDLQAYCQILHTILNLTL